MAGGPSVSSLSVAPVGSLVWQRQGKAVLTIDYGTYQVDPVAPLVAGGN